MEALHGLVWWLRICVLWRLEVEGRGVILSRGEVAEWLNAAVSKTVMSVIPASGVRIPPSPLVGATPDSLY